VLKPRKYNPELTRARIFKWCDQKEHTHWETREKLIAWGVPHGERENLIAELIEGQYINEKRYAQAFASDKFRFYGWGTRKIEVNLKKKGVSDRNIQDALKAIVPADYEQVVSKLIDKKWRSLRDKDPRKRKMKVFRYMASKGYESELVSKILGIYITRSGLQADE
jgi:regulatory protein